MKSTELVLFLIASMLFLCAAALPGALGQTAAGNGAKKISLGLISEVNQKQITERFDDFARYVARRLYAPGSGEGSVVVARSLPDMVRLLEQAKADYFIESVYATYVINQVHGAARLLLRRWKGGKAEYRSLLAAGKGGVTRLEELRERTVAFEDPESTSGYFLPKFFLQRSGFKLAQVAAPTAAVPSGQIGYVFAGTHDNLIRMVLSQEVAAGALSDDDYAVLAESVKPQLRILAQTELLPRHLVSVRKSLAPEIIQALSRVLTTMHENEEGKAIMAGIDNTTRFDLLPGGEEMMRRRLLDTFHAPPR